MIMTVVTEDGRLQAAAAGDMRWDEVSKRRPEPGQFLEALSALPGQTVQIVEVPDKFGGLMSDPSGLMAELTTLLKQRGLL